MACNVLSLCSSTYDACAANGTVVECPADTEFCFVLFHKMSPNSSQPTTSPASAVGRKHDAAEIWLTRGCAPVNYSRRICTRNLHHCMATSCWVCCDKDNCNDGDPRPELPTPPTPTNTTPPVPTAANHGETAKATSPTASLPSQVNNSARNIILISTLVTVASLLLIALCVYVLIRFSILELAPPWHGFEKYRA